ncbi:MAG: ABC transporter permease [Anaerolineae bacterium]
MTTSTTTAQAQAQAPDLLRAVRSEIVKLHNSAVPVTVTVLPGVITCIVAILATGARPFKPADAWIDLTGQMIIFWSTMLPFMASIVTAMLAGTEHNGNMWKHLFALPINRTAVYAAKQIMALALFGLSIIVTFIAIIATGLFLRSAKPNWGFEASIPVAEIAVALLLSWLASWLLIALHQWAGVHFRGFGAAIAFGLVAFLINVVVSARTDLWKQILPWALPYNFVTSSLTQSSIDWAVASRSALIGVIGCLVTTLLMSWLESRRDVG